MPFIVVDNVEYRLKTVREKAQAVLDTATLGERLPEKESRFMSSLLRRHPQREKLLNAVQAPDETFCLKVDFAAFGNRCFYFLRQDGTWEDISYRYCCVAKPKEPSADFKFAYACRMSILADIQSIRRQMVGEECPLTGEVLTLQNMHVHHETPTFQTIVDAFKGHSQLNLAILEYVGEQLYHFKEEQHARDFAKFHNERANLVVVLDAIHRYGGLHQRI